MWQENRDRPFTKTYSILLTEESNVILHLKNTLVLGAVLQVTATMLF